MRSPRLADSSLASLLDAPSLVVNTWPSLRSLTPLPTSFKAFVHLNQFGSSQLDGRRRLALALHLNGSYMLSGIAILMVNQFSSSYGSIQQ
jgi:hypothetical protein